MGSLGEVALSLQAGGKKGDSGYWGITPFHIYSSLSDQPGSCMLEFVSETGFEDLFFFMIMILRNFPAGRKGIIGGLHVMLFIIVPIFLPVRYLI